jgi:hypothetical protein
VNAKERKGPPLGQMLVAKGLVTEDGLMRALRVHEETRRPLGEVLVELGLVSVTALADALLLQHAWRPLGRMLVDKGLLDEEQLADALQEQERSGRPLGEIVRTRYFLSASQIGDVLADQHQLELEMDRGFGSGLRRGIDERQRRERGTPARDEGGDTERMLGRRLDAARESDRLSVLRAALGDREEVIDALGVAHRERAKELAELRERLSEQERLIDDLRTRLSAAGRAEFADRHRS